MVSIQNIEEFNRIKESDFGFMIIDGENPQIHKPNCDLVNVDDFIKVDTNEKKFLWFSTILLAEKEFPQIIFCQKCNPD
jgi:hypothetical protein